MANGDSKSGLNLISIMCVLCLADCVLAECLMFIGSLHAQFVKLRMNLIAEMAVNL